MKENPDGVLPLVNHTPPRGFYPQEVIQVRQKCICRKTVLGRASVMRLTVELKIPDLDAYNAGIPAV